jgi:hypothetical protein
MEKTPDKTKLTPAQLIDAKIAELKDWRGPMFIELRKLINAAAPGIKEEWKWGTVVWTHHGLVCSVNAFKDHVKVHFFKGSEVADPKGLFNAGLDAKDMRAIDYNKGSTIDSAGLADLVRTAVAVNNSSEKKR